MAGLVPAIHVFVLSGLKDVDARDMRGHDDSVKSHPVSGVADQLDRGASNGIYHWYLSHGGATVSATAKLFKHGRSQAVRLPKEFRFEGTEVKVSKVGEKVILEPLKKRPVDLEKFWAELDALGARDFLPEGAPEDPPAEPDPRVFFDE